MSDEAPNDSTNETKAFPLLEERMPGEPGSNSQAVIFAIVAWMAPGLGHLFLRRWGKAAAFFGAVAALIVLGCTMRGEVFAPGSDGPLGTLDFFADLGSGAFYFLTRALESPRVDLSSATGDYGTRLIAAAGIINVLAVIDAFETAAHRKTKG